VNLLRSDPARVRRALASWLPQRGRRQQTLYKRWAVAILLSACTLLGQGAGDWERLVQKADQALAEGRYAEAAETYEKLKRLGPLQAEIRARLGLSYFQLRRYEEAVAELQEAVRLRPRLAHAGVLLAMALCELGRFREALPGLEQGFRSSSDPALKRMSGLELQRAYTGLGRDREAVEVAFEMVKLFPGDAEVLYHASRLFANYAYLTAQKLAEVAPDSVWARLAAAEALESVGKYDLAVRGYREVASQARGMPGVHYRAGRALLLAGGSGAEREALQEFEQELQIDPTNANAAYEAAEIYRQWGELSKARRLFELALKYYADFQEAHVGLARVLLAQGEVAGAISHLEEAIRLNPQDDVAYYQLWRAHQKAGNGPQAQRARAQFLELRARKTRQEMVRLRKVTEQQLDPEEQTTQPGP